MKSLIIFLVAICITSAFDDDEWVEGRPVITPRLDKPEVAAYADAAQAVCDTADNPSVKFCASTPGCKELDSTVSTGSAQYYQCGVSGVAPNLTACGDIFKYCIIDPLTGGGSCASESPLCKSPFVCPGIGFYPNPSNCLEYYNCKMDGNGTDAQLVAYLQSCPKYYPFHPIGYKNSKCRRGGSYYCVTATCKAGFTGWVPMNYYNFTSDRYALRCDNGVSGGLQECPAGLSIDITKSNELSCILKCKRNYQMAAVLTDKTKYFICYGKTPVIQQCGNNQVFDTTQLKCVAST